MAQRRRFSIRCGQKGRLRAIHGRATKLPRQEVSSKRLSYLGPTLISLCSLAWAEMNLILSKVIWSFDLELGEGNKDDWSDQRIWLLHAKTSLYVKISPRGS